MMPHQSLLASLKKIFFIATFWSKPKFMPHQSLLPFLFFFAFAFAAQFVVYFLQHCGRHDYLVIILCGMILSLGWALMFRYYSFTFLPCRGKGKSA